MQKFHQFDHVKISKDKCAGFFNKKENIEAVVIGSFSDQYGGDNTKSYTLYVNGHDECAWFEDKDLTLIDKNGENILEEWKKNAKIKHDEQSNLDWIFKNGLSVLNGASGSSIEALALCLGIKNLWGSHGEGYVYHMNAMKVLCLAKPYLENDDKDGWLEFCNCK